MVVAFYFCRLEGLLWVCSTGLCVHKTSPLSPHLLTCPFPSLPLDPLRLQRSEKEPINRLYTLVLSVMCHISGGHSPKAVRAGLEAPPSSQLFPSFSTTRSLVSPSCCGMMRPGLVHPPQLSPLHSFCLFSVSVCSKEKSPLHITQREGTPGPGLLSVGTAPAVCWGHLFTKT